MCSPDQVARVLADGPATYDEIVSAFPENGQKRAMIRKSINRMKGAGEIRRRPMFQCSERRTTVKPLLVWELVKRTEAEA